jgi:hypothetical protein
VAAVAGAAVPIAPRVAALATPTRIRADRSSPDDPLDRTGGETSDENTRIPPHFRWRGPSCQTPWPDLRHTNNWVNRPTSRARMRGKPPSRSPP